MKVTVLNPGWVDTKLARLPGLDPQKMIKPQDVADATMYALTVRRHACTLGLMLQHPPHTHLQQKGRKQANYCYRAAVMCALLTFA